jgi:hypothetical protein
MGGGGANPELVMAGVDGPPFLRGAMSSGCSVDGEVMHYRLQKMQ